MTFAQRILKKVAARIIRHGLDDELIQLLYSGYEQRKEDVVLASFKSVGSNVKLPFPNRFINPQYISIGNNVQSLYNLRIEAIDAYAGDSFAPEIIIGNNIWMNTDIHIGAINKIVIQDNALLASRIYISDHSHGAVKKGDLSVVPIKRRLVSRGPVIIEENAWIGEGVCIMPGVTIGRNSVIGANAVVTRSIPPNSVAAGIPARVIRSI